MAVPNFEEFDTDFASPAQWAEMYRHYGLQVVPGWMPGEPKNGSWKRPFLSNWTTIQDALVPDPAFARWYDPKTGDHRKRRNMGILTGACSGGVFIVDLDIPKHPEAAQWWYNICRVHNNGMEPHTPHQQTGGGGQQWLFRAPPGWTPPTGKTSIGVDLRGQGGFAVMPASLHESGKAYEWILPPWGEVPILEAPAWLCQEIDKLVGAQPAAAASPGVRSERPHKPTSGSEFDDFGNRVDGREEAMRDMVWRCVVKLRRASPIQPIGSLALQILQDEYEVYERTVSVQNPIAGEPKRAGLDRENRGFKAFTAKWQYAMKQWDADVARAASEPDPHPEQPPDPAAEFQEAADKAQARAKADPSGAGTYEMLDVLQIKTLADPRWLVDGMVVEQALGFIYGPPGCLKTFIALDMALSFACALPSWWDRSIQRGGTVIYLTTEGVPSFKYRIMAWEQHRGVNADAAPFRLIRQSINFMKLEDIEKLLLTVHHAVNLWGPVAAVVVDTVSRVLPGAEENLQKDMTIFVAACVAVQQTFGATVIGLHHSSRAGNMRGSTVLGAAGDFVIAVTREPGAMTGSIFAEKIKDAEDGWTRPFKVTKVPVGLGAHTSLVLDGTDAKVDDGDDTAWPERDTCRQILAALHEQWDKGQPWCWSANSPRCGPKNIIHRWDNIRLSVAEDILNKWHARGIICEEVRDAKNHIKGYRKLVDI